MQKRSVLLVAALFAVTLPLSVSARFWPPVGQVAPTTQLSITVLSPNGGESWQPGKTYSIVWAANGVDKINIDLVRGNLSWRIATNRLAEDKPVNFTVPPDIESLGYGLGFVVHIWDAEHPSIEDTSDTVFAIEQAIASPIVMPMCTITSDKSSYKLGDTITFFWKSQNATYARWLEDTSGKDYLHLPGDKLPANGTQTVVANVLGNPSVTLLVANENGKGECGMTIHIADSTQPTITVLSPNGGETYKHDGSPITVNWQTNNVQSSETLDVIRLRAYPNGQEYNLAYRVLNDDHEVIVPSSVPVGTYTLEIKTYVNGILVMDSSDSYFKIIDVTTPLVSEQVKCVFNGATTEQRCDTAYASDSPLSFTCSGIGTCVADVKGSKNTALTWKSSCGGYAYTTLDGMNEYTNFSCGTTTIQSSPSPVCVGCDSDAHGCKPSAGYSWCAAKQKCLRTWEEPCSGTTSTSPSAPPAGYEDEVLTNFDTYKNPFPDTDMADLSGKAAAELYRRAIIGGFPDGQFKGDRPVNRAEATKFLLLAHRDKEDFLPELMNNGKFPDVLDGQWYTKYVIGAAKLGIINGNPDGTFRPANAVNTAEFLKMLALTFGLQKDLPYRYSDVSSGDWFAAYAGVAVKYNLFPGRTSFLSPEKNLTRQEVAVAIYQYLSNK